MNRGTILRVDVGFYVEATQTILWALLDSLYRIRVLLDCQ